MADNYWTAAIDSDGAKTGNWSLARVPTTGDTAKLSASGGGADTTCTLGVSIACDAIEVASDFTQTLDLNGYNITTTGNQLYQGAGTVTGTGTLACGGDFDHFDLIKDGTWTGTNIDLVLDGTGKNWTTYYAGLVRTVVIDGSITLVAVKVSDGIRGEIKPPNDGTVGLTINEGKSLTITAGDDLRSWYKSAINGTLTINSGGRLLNINDAATVGANGVVTGAGTYEAQNCRLVNNGTWSVTATEIKQNSRIDSGVFGGAFTIRNQNSTRTMRFCDAGNVTFEGPVTVTADVASALLNCWVVGNPATLTFEDNFTLTESAADAELDVDVHANSTVVFDGDSTFNYTTPQSGANDTFGDIEVSGDLTLASNLLCDTFEGQNGGNLDTGGNDLETNETLDFQSGFTVDDPVGSTFDVGSDFTADAQDLTASGVWSLTVSGTAVASGSGTVANSDASGGTTIDAKTWTDAGGNTNWFIVKPQWYYQHAMMGAA